MDKLQKLEAAFARGAHDEANAILADLKVRAVARRRGVVIARRRSHTRSAFRSGRSSRFLRCRRVARRARPRRRSGTWRATRSRLPRC